MKGLFTGCVATAIAQVMRYHEYPTTYNWGIMPNGNITATNQPPGTNEIAELMRDVGDDVFMQWGCDPVGSGADGHDMEPAMVGYGYSSFMDYEAYDPGKVKNEFEIGRPVILGGFDGQFGHAWVADGYRETRYCNGELYLYFNMNWGWNGEENGWYAPDNFDPGNLNFDSGLVQLVEIFH